MASRGRGRRGRPRGTGQAPPIFDQPPAFDQQAFTEAVGIAATATAHASIAGSQGGPSNLKRFRAHHPPTFTRGGDPMVADHWFMQIENILEAMEITSDTARIRLAAFQLEGDSSHSRVSGIKKFVSYVPPTAVVKLLQHSGLGSNTGMGFHPMNDVHQCLKMVRLFVWICGFVSKK